MGYKALANVTARNMIITLKQVEFGRQKFAELLLLLLLLFVVNNSKEQIRFTSKGTMTKSVLFDVGMTCGGCSAAVTRILKKVEGEGFADWLLPPCYMQNVTNTAIYMNILIFV